MFPRDLGFRFRDWARQHNLTPTLQPSPQTGVYPGAYYEDILGWFRAENAGPLVFCPKEHITTSLLQWLRGRKRARALLSNSDGVHIGCCRKSVRAISWQVHRLCLPEGANETAQWFAFHWDTVTPRAFKLLSKEFEGTSPEDLEDMWQEAVTRLIGLDSFNHTLSPPNPTIDTLIAWAYLKAVTFRENQGADILGRLYRGLITSREIHQTDGYVPVPIYTLAPTDLDALPTKERNPEEVMVVQGQWESTFDLLRQLFPVHYARTLEAYLEGYTAKEIGEMEGMTVRQFRNIQQRMRRKRQDPRMTQIWYGMDHPPTIADRPQCDSRSPRSTPRPQPEIR